MADGGDGTIIPFPQPANDPVEQAVFGSDTDALLEQRAKTHGPYPVKAEIIQNLKCIMRAYPGWLVLSDVQRESLDMIAHKVGRILSGDPNEPDHWKDIEGYSRLVSKHLGSGDGTG